VKIATFAKPETVGGNLKKQLTTKNIQENDTVTND
jgi:hypothetical protein